MRCKRLTILLLAIIGAFQGVKADTDRPFSMQSEKAVPQGPTIRLSAESCWERWTFVWTIEDFDSSCVAPLRESVLLAVPESAAVRLVVSEDEAVPWTDGMPVPIVSHSKGDDGTVLTWPDSINARPLVVEPVGSMRGVRIVRLTYNAVTTDKGICILHKYIRGSIEFSGADAELTMKTWCSKASATFGPLTKMLANSGLYEDAVRTKRQRDAMESMAIVAPCEWRDVLAPFLRWRRQCGIRVIEHYFAGGTADPDTVKKWLRRDYADTGYMQHAYINSASMALLVGDASILPQMRAEHRPSELQSYRTDLYYGEFSGDYLPEMLVGRWSVADTSQLREVVAKTLSYERQGTFDSLSLGSALLVAGRELRDPAPVATNGMVNYVGDMLASSGIDTACYRNPESDSLRQPIMNRLAGGNAIVGYTSHCTTMGWLHPNFLTTDVDTMDFEGHYGLVVNNCCLSNQVGSDCFGEHLLRKPGGGAIGVIGASGETLWEEDYYWAVGGQELALHPVYCVDSNKGAYQSLMSSTLSQGQMVAAGNIAVSRYGSPYDAYYWEIYSLLGDPALVPYMGTPASLPLRAAPPRRGTSLVAVSSLPDAVITVMQGDSLLGYAVADSSGAAMVVCRQSVTDTVITVTATKRGYVPKVMNVITLADSNVLGIRTTEKNAEGGIRIWPNPVRSGAMLTVEFCRREIISSGLIEESLGIKTVRVFDALGKSYPVEVRNSGLYCDFQAPARGGVYYVVVLGRSEGRRDHTVATSPVKMIVVE